MIGSPVRIWCVGDSITEGAISGSTASPGGGYRATIRANLFAAQRAFLFVGTLTGSDLPATKHDGHGGYTIELIRANRAAWQATALPDLVLLMLGTNNLVTVNRAREMRDGGAFGLLRLVEELASGAGDPAVIVSAISPVDLTVAGYSPDTPGLITRFNTVAQAGVLARAAQGLPVSWVNPSLTTADLSDGVHPTAAAYTGKIAPAFQTAVDAYFGGL